MFFDSEFAALYAASGHQNNATHAADHQTMTDLSPQKAHMKNPSHLNALASISSEQGTPSRRQWQKGTNNTTWLQRGVSQILDYCDSKVHSNHLFPAHNFFQYFWSEEKVETETGSRSEKSWYLSNIPSSYHACEKQRVNSQVKVVLIFLD